jgi:hypothetical protein
MMNVMAKAEKLVPLTIRLSPDSYKGLAKVIGRHPHLSMNVLINKIIEAELAAPGSKKAT